MQSNRWRSEARRRFASGIRTRGVALAAATLLAAAALPASAQDFKADPNWPCVQRKVPSISSGMVWAGPPVEEVGDSWKDDPAIAKLAAKIASRRTPIEDAEKAVAQFAEKAGADKERKLTMLFAGALDIINHDRGSIIAGIERYAKRQKALADKIESQSAQLAALPAEAASEQDSKRADLQEMQNWDIRIFEEREHSLTYVCEQPVLLEKRAFSLGRDIMSHLD